MVLADPHVNFIGRFIMCLITMCVIATTVIVVYLSYYESNDVIAYIDLCILGVFGLEMIGRVASYTAYGSRLWRVVDDVYFWVDLISIIPLVV